MKPGRIRTALAAVAAAAAVLVGVALPAPAHAVIDGAIAGKTRFTVRVDTLRDDGTRTRCSGILVEQSWVLTAKHCLGPRPSSMTVRAGSRELNGGYERTLKGFTGWSEADVALLELASPVPLTSTPFPYVGLRPAGNSLLAASGWGMVDDRNWTDRLKVCTVRLDQYQVNENGIWHYRFVRVDGIQFHGDSGGPISDGSGVTHAMTIQGNGVDRATAVALADEDLQDWILSHF